MILKTKWAGFNPFTAHETFCWVYHTVLVMRQNSIFLKILQIYHLITGGTLFSGTSHQARVKPGDFRSLLARPHLLSLTSIICQFQSTSLQWIFPKHQSNVLSFSVFKVTTFPEISLQYVPTTCRCIWCFIFAYLTMFSCPNSLSIYWYN
jgi:hypothetical protein